MQEPSKSTGFRRVRSRLGVVTVLAGFGLVASGCGGPSAATVAAQNLSAGISAQRAGHFATAIADYKKVLAAEPTNAYALFDLGDVDQFEHRDAAALKKYQAALAIDPTMVPALYNLATLVSSFSPNEARVLYQQVIQQDPTDADAYFNLGYVMFTLGQRAAGIADINRAVTLDPSLRSRILPSTTSTSTSTLG